MSTNVRSVLYDRICGTLYGNCVGDAIGLLTEFMFSWETKRYYKCYQNLEYEHKVPDRHRTGWETGDWTDDADQMILIMLSLADNNGQIDLLDFAKRMKYWMKRGFPELGDCIGQGLGKTTGAVVNHPLFLTDPSAAAAAVWVEGNKQIASNGAVMRTSVLGVYQFNDIEKVIQNTTLFCTATHADYRCLASCVAVATAVAIMLQGKHLKADKISYDTEAIIEESYQYAEICIPQELEEAKKYRSELKFHMSRTTLKDLKLDEYSKIGYTYKTMGAGFWALKQEEFRPALQAIVMAGGDADTNGAVAGALLGCKLGQSKIPTTWLTGLRHKEWFNAILERFLKMAFPDLPKSETTIDDETE